MQLLRLVTGGFFAQDGGSVSLSQATAPDGAVNVGLVRGGASSVSGEGELLQVKLRARAAGEAALRLESASPVSTQGMPTAELPAPWLVQVR